MLCCCHLCITLCFQVSRLAALFVKGPKSSLNAFTIDLSDIVLPESDVLSAITCVQHFVKDTHFSRRSFFMEKGVESPRPGYFELWQCEDADELQSLGALEGPIN